MIILGLTGSIGMGKSTTAKMFAEEDVPVHDADATVHALYSGKAAPLIEETFPGTVRNGTVDRSELGKRVVGNAEAMKKLEAIVHPLVREAEIAFLEHARAEKHPLAVLDIPLLFETGGEERVDYVAVVTAPAKVQRERVMARPGMTEERFEALLAKQMPDAEKRRRADFLIDTSLGMEAARAKVRDIVGVLTAIGPRKRSTGRCLSAIVMPQPPAHHGDEAILRRKPCARSFSTPRRPASIPRWTASSRSARSNWKTGSSPGGPFTSSSIRTAGRCIPRRSPCTAFPTSSSPTSRNSSKSSRTGFDFTEGATLIAHNASFDVGFFNAEFARLGFPPVDPDRVIDSLSLARRRHPMGPNSLDALCKRYGIDNSKREKHGALARQ
jgi:dephospho-CoA kinase